MDATIAGLRGPLVIAAHDAGGAEILSGLLLREGLLQRLDCRLALDGPARAVFARKLGEVPILSLDAALQGAATLISGTGWMSTFEWLALQQARAAGLRTIAFLDHWVNYRMRFVRDGQSCLPDELWVGDADALVLARRDLPELPATLVDNPYFAEMRETLTALADKQPVVRHGLRVLYVCEPVRGPALRQYGNERHHGYTEEEALAYALAELPMVLGPIERIVLRPHPSEAPEKYDQQIAALQLPVLRGGGAPLCDEVAASDVVVGCNSVAMVVGLLAGKRVLCAIPPGGKACVLPHSGIEMLRDRVAALALT